jgi:predicted amidohydrolase YtcJ
MRNTTAAPEPRKTAGRQRNHNGIVARQNDVDPDDLEQTNPEINALNQFHLRSPVLLIKKSAQNIMFGALLACLS